MRVRSMSVAAAAAVVLFGAAGCGGSEKPSSASSAPVCHDSSGQVVWCGPTVSPSPSTSAAPKNAVTYPDNWKARFPRDDLDAALAAIDDWNSCSSTLDDVYRAGKFTPTAVQSLEECDFWWQRDQSTLKTTYDEGDLRRISDVKPLWIYAESVKLDKAGQTGTVVLTQCTDYRPLAYTRNGKPQKIAKPKHLVTPLTITLTKPDTKHGWMLYGTKIQDKKSCVGD